MVFRSLLAALVLAACSFAAVADAPNPANPDMLLGMSMVGGSIADGGDDVGPADPVQLMAERDNPLINASKMPGYHWPEVQPTDPGSGPNVYLWPDPPEGFPGYARGKMRMAYAQMYGSTPSWLVQDTPRFWEKFEQFYEAATIRLNNIYGQVDWIFENEPNISRAPAGWNWADWYIHCLQHFHTAIHRANAVTGIENKVIAGNLSGHSAGGFADLYARGLKSCSDVLGYHPYPYDIRDGLKISDLQQIHSIQVQYGDDAKKIIVTEGWGSGRSAGFDRSSPTIDPSAEEIENMYLAMVKGWDSVMTPAVNWDPSYLYGMRFFCGNDNWGAMNWRKRAIPQKDGGGNIVGFIVDGYWMTPDIAPQFWNGGMLDFYGNSKDALALVFPGNGLVYMNAGFELASPPPSSHLPHFWTPFSSPAPSANYSLDTSVYHNGQRSLRMSRTSGGGGVWQATAKRSVVPGRTYQVSVWARPQSVSGMTLRMYLRYQDLAGAAVSSPVYAPDVTGTGDWRKVTVSAVAPASASRAEVGFLQFGSGTVWIDDVTIRQASASDNGTLQGYTLDENQVVVPNCIVRTTTGGYQSISDAGGFYHIENVGPGTYDLVCRKDGYVPSRISNQTVASEKLTMVSFAMRVPKPGLTVTSVALSGSVSSPGQAVTAVVTVSNSRPYPVTLSEVGVFVEASGADATGKFDIRAADGNPKVVPAMSSAQSSFSIQPRQEALGGSFRLNAYAFGQEDRPNLLTNGGFDETDPFHHWGFYGESSVCQWPLDTADFYSPPRSLKNVASDTASSKFNWGGNHSAWGATAAPAKPDRNYIVGAYHKDSTTGRVDLNLFIEEFYYNGDDWLYNGRHFSAVPHRSTWTNDRMVYKTGNPAVTPGLYSTNRLKVSIGSFIGTGGGATTAWWDDVYLKEEGDWLADDRAASGTLLLVPENAAGVAAARALTGKTVTIPGLVVTSGEGQKLGRVYLQQPDRAAGLLALPESAQYPAEGSLVTIAGKISADGDELTLSDAVFSSAAPGQQARPLNVSQTQFLQAGPPLSGLLVRVWGRVSYVHPSGSFFTLDDGAGLVDASGAAGIRIDVSGLSAPVTLPTVGEWVSATGVRWSQSGVACIRPRGPGDIAAL